MEKIKNFTRYLAHPRMTFYIFLCIFISRFIASFTHLSWAHPDEWYQTVELGHYIYSHIMSFTEVMPLHYRNLTWPMFISWLIAVSDFLSPHSISFRLWLIRFSTSFLDFLSLFGVYLLVQKLEYSAKQRSVIFIFLSLFWSQIADSVRPSQEHLSQIFFWFSIFFYFYSQKSKNNSFFLLLCGVLCALTGVVRYPSGLLSLGLLTYFLGFSSLFIKEKAFIIRGVFLGLLLGGVSDLLIYGRAYESLWMYLQYNVFTQLGQNSYGTQSSFIYLDLFTGRFRGIFQIFVPFFIFFFLIGFIRSAQKKEIVIFPFIFFILGHFLIGHKEPRFLLPVELIFYYFSWSGLFYVYNFSFKHEKMIQSFLKYFIVLFFIINFIYFFIAIRGEFLKKNWSTLFLDTYLKDNKNICGVISLNRPYSLSLPYQTSQNIPEPPYAYFPLKESIPLSLDSPEFNNIPLIWIQKKPECLDIDKILLQLPRHPFDFDKHYQCKTLSQGIARFLPHRFQSGIWLKCSSNILNLFKKQEVRKVISSYLPRLQKLPPYGISEDELKSLIKENSEPGIQDGVMVDW